MNDNDVLPESRAAPSGTSLALLRLPFSFSQEPLLHTSAFLDLAKEWGERITLDELSSWHSAGVFLPYFSVVDDADSRWIVDLPADERSEPADYARRGRLRDAAFEPPGSATYERPADAEAGWWDGFLFSRWQILDVKYARNRFGRLQHDDDSAALRYEAVEKRRESLALSVLATRQLPLIVGQIMHAGDDERRLERSRFDVDDARRLSIVQYPASELRGTAEFLLSSARFDDPMADWWPLIRHSNHSGWSKIRGSVRYAVERRIAAELLLRAHESLSDIGVVSPLPGPNPDRHYRDVLYDRISPGPVVADSLDRALGALGLSPYPRVLLLLEGATEVTHVNALLAELGLSKPNRVRIQNMRTSNASPAQIAQYATSPRVGPQRYGVQLFDATPTALFVAMDPENRWMDHASREEQRRLLHLAIREEVAAQGAEVTDGELDILVHIFVWGDQKYELANFSDHELEEGLIELAREKGCLPDDAAAWRADLAASLAYARERSLDVSVVFQRARIPEAKLRLAEILLPALMQKFEHEISNAGNISTPVVEMVMQVRDLVHRLAGGTYSFQTPPTTPALGN